MSSSLPESTEEAFLSFFEKVYSQKNWMRLTLDAFWNEGASHKFSTARELRDAFAENREDLSAESVLLPLALKTNLKRLYRLGLGEELLDVSVAIVFSTPFFFYSNGEYSSSPEKARKFYRSLFLSREEYEAAARETLQLSGALIAFAKALVARTGQQSEFSFHSFSNNPHMPHFRLKALQLAWAHRAALSAEAFWTLLQDEPLLTQSLASEGYLLGKLEETHSLEEILLLMAAAPQLRLEDWDKYLEDEVLHKMPLEWWLPLV